MRSKLLLLAALAVGTLIGATLRQARADADSETHQIRIALERQTAALEKIAHSLDRMVDRR